MIRAKVKAFGQNYGDRILIRSLSELNSYFEEVFGNVVKETVQTTYDRAIGRAQNKYVGHALDSFVGVAETVSMCRQISPVNAAIDLFGSVEKNMIEFISNGQWIIINPVNKISYFNVKPTDPTVEIEIISENEIYTKDDIKVFKWENGSHWYAKVGLQDVVIDGEQKWNAKWIAQNKAEEFLEIANNKN
jgi:hypothetical protein